MQNEMKMAELPGRFFQYSAGDWETSANAPTEGYKAHLSGCRIRKLMERRVVMSAAHVTDVTDMNVNEGLRPGALSPTYTDEGEANH